MAKQVRYLILKQGGKQIPVRVKTTTETYIRKLIADYKRIGKLDSGDVEWEVL